MGTRGAYGYRIDGGDKVMYNHFDSHPEGLGRDILKYVRDYSDAEIREAAARVILVDGDKPASAAMAKRYKKFADTGVGTQTDTDWYCLLREVQRNPGAFHNGLDHMLDGHTFLANSLFCEYAYIVNVDDRTLEFYRGFNEDRKARGRYAALERGKKYPEDEQKYSGVKLMEAVPFATVRDVQPAKMIKRWDKLCRDPEDE